MIINVDMIYPIGSLYITTSTVSPAVSFGGTWTQITNDAYLKIVTSNAGSLGGTSSNHKIPVSSMPSHSHPYNQWVFNGSSASGTHYGYGWESNTGTMYNNMPSSWASIGNTGGGQAYYPYYYGVYVWKRTA